MNDGIESLRFSSNMVVDMGGRGPNICLAVCFTENKKKRLGAERGCARTNKDMRYGRVKFMAN